MNSRKNIFSESAHLSTEQMLSYLRHQLTRDEARKVEHHLSDCDLCNDALEGLKKVKSDSQLLSITTELQKMARKRRVTRKKLFSTLDIIAVFAIFFLILFLIFIAVVMYWPG